MSHSDASLKRIAAFLGSLEGRDQSLKCLQYGSRFWMWLLITATTQRDMAARLEGLYKGSSSSRKAFRLLKSLAQYEKASQIVAKPGADRRRDAAAVLSYVGLGVYYLFDNLSFLAKVKALKTPEKEFSSRGFHFYFIGSAAAALYILMDMQQIQDRELLLRRAIACFEPTADDVSDDDLRAQIEQLRAKRFDLLLQLLKSICNTVIAANNAEYLPAGRRLNDGVLGILGFIAGATSCWKVWQSVGTPSKAKAT